MASPRSLHYVFKIGDRKRSISFFKDTLKMKVLRHEEFKEGCEASCNGPYDGAWSKTMIGYGPEDDHFVIELTYNYGIGNYKHGSDFAAIHIMNRDIFSSLIAGSYPTIKEGENCLKVISPCGYPFIVHDENSPIKDFLTKCSLYSSNLAASKKFWVDLLKMNCLSQTEDSLCLTYGSNQCSLEFIKSKKPIDHAKAYGRVAFSTPYENLEDIQSTVIENGCKVLKPLVGLDTPGKAKVYVVILADPDDHEICFVGDEAFRDLSQVDPNADRLLTDAMASDNSDEWFNRHGGKLSD